MSDYNYHGPEDPFRRDDVYDPNVRSGNTAWGWIAAAVALVAVLALLIGIGRQTVQPGTNTASNDNPPATRMAPPSPAPSNVPPTTAMPAPANPAPPAGAPTQQH